KPFDLDELAARLHSLVRRSAGRSRNIVEYGPLYYDPVSSQVSMHGKAVSLSRRELAILEALLQQPRRVLAPGQLQDHVYGGSEGLESTGRPGHVHDVRRKLGDDLIETVRGLG